MVDFTGKSHEFSEREIMQLAQHGLDTAVRAQEPEKEPEPEKAEELTVQSLSEKLTKANEEFTEYKAGKEKEAQLHQYKADLDAAVDGLELIKEYPSQRHSIMTQAAMLMGQTKITINDAVAQIAKDRLDFLKEFGEKRSHANNKVSAIVNQVHPGSGTPALVLDKPLTSEAVTSGRSQRDVMAFLDSLRET